MSLDTAIRFTEILLALAFLQQSFEHLATAQNERKLFLPRLILSILLILGMSTKFVCILLFINGVFILKRFKGPYNGGSDRMGLLIISCLCLIHFSPTLFLRQIVMGYLGLQVILSYFLPGIVKALNKEWWNGQVLQDLFSFSVFPASEAIRTWSNRPKLLRLASWGVILFELLFPLVLVNQTTLIIGLVTGISFHFANTYFLGFNRFVWVWLAAYPSLIWLESYLITN